MFGYIQPLKCELKVREYDYYRAAYCGLCNALRTRCGIKARFIVNYDFVFLALLLSCAEKTEETISKKRCVACPSGRMCVQSSSYDLAADISVVLTFLKLCDDVSDNGFWRSLFKARLPRLLLKSAYKKASKALTEYTIQSKQLYDELSALEGGKCKSLDETADKFANMLAIIADESMVYGRVLKEVFYHIGRFIYIIDALDDFEEDFDKKEYNPIIERFGADNKHMPEDVKEYILTTLEDSRLAVLRAFELLPEADVKNLLRNIIELGMPSSVHRVLKKEKHK